MGLFRNKKRNSKDSSKEDIIAAEEHFFDQYFREELRNHGRWYFEKVINENGELFKRDLEDTIKQINVELKEHIAQQLDAALVQMNAELKEHTTNQLKEQFVEFSKSLESAQDDALETIVDSTRQLKEQHDALRTALERNIGDQKAILHDSFEENKTEIIAMKDAQATALKWLTQSAEALHAQYQQMSTMLQKGVSEQQDLLIAAFENNMTQIVEHYLLEALADQFDIKDQLPSIIQQMESNKQAIVDDMKL